MTKERNNIVVDQNDLKQLESRIHLYHEELVKLSTEDRKSLDKFLDITWCYHEFAIEGVVLSHLEIKSALDDRIISDSSLIPHYDAIKSFNLGVAKVKSDGAKKRLTLNINSVKEIHSLISSHTQGKSSSYRKEMPLHRQYAHDFSPPEKIPYRMRKFGEWIQTQTFKKTPVLLKAAAIHNRIMSIFPWHKNSGTIARLAMNLVLIHSGYPIALIPDVERQTYYENILVDLSHETDVRMVNFLKDSIDVFLHSMSKKLRVNF
jgi:Fic family protein